AGLHEARRRHALGRRDQVDGADLVVLAPAPPVAAILDVRAHFGVGGQRAFGHLVLRAGGMFGHRGSYHTRNAPTTLSMPRRCATSPIASRDTGRVRRSRDTAPPIEGDVAPPGAPLEVPCRRQYRSSRGTRERRRPRGTSSRCPASA